MTEEEHYKKFVFKIYEENIHFIESLPVEERNDFINDIISKYSKKYRTAKDFFDKVRRTRNISTSVGLIIIAIPTLYIMHLLSKTLTELNFNLMRNNFVHLFEAREKEINEFEEVLTQSVKTEGKAANQKILKAFDKIEKESTHKTESVGKAFHRSIPVYSTTKNENAIPNEKILEAFEQIEKEEASRNSSLQNIFNKRATSKKTSSKKTSPPKDSTDQQQTPKQEQKE